MIDDLHEEQLRDARTLEAGQLSYKYFFFTYSTTSPHILLYLNTFFICPCVTGGLLALLNLLTRLSIGTLFSPTRSHCAAA